MSYELKGKVKKVGPVLSIGSNGFKKREIVVVTGDQYPQPVLFEFTQDKCALLDAVKEEDTITIFFNVRGREWVNPEGEAKYFNSLQGWKFNNEGNEDNDNPPF